MQHWAQEHTIRALKYRIHHMLSSHHVAAIMWMRFDMAPRPSSPWKTLNACNLWVYIAVYH